MMTGNAAGLAEIHQFGIATFTAGFAQNLNIQPVAAAVAEAAPAQPAAGLAVSAGIFHLAPASLAPSPSVVQLPAAPTFTATAVSATQINLSWTPQSSATGYRVEELVNGKWEQIGSFGAGTTSDAITGLTGDTTYTFNVVAFNAKGSTSGVASATTTLQDWFSQHLSDPGVQNLARADYYAHGTLTRADMLGIFTEVETDGTVSTAEFNSLMQIADDGYRLNMSPSVGNLTNKLVNGDNANQFAGDGISASGNLVAGASAAGLKALVNDWFLGEGPLADVGGGLTPVSGPLFGTSGPLFTDTAQGAVGDCTLISTLAGIAARDPQTIANMFQDNGDGTYTVRFFDNGSPTYVTVNSTLPAGGNLYDHPQGNLWVALAEKAIVEVNESGWLDTADMGSNSYAALNGTGNWLPAILGNSSAQYLYSADPVAAAAAWNAGNGVLFGSNPAGGPDLVGDHFYAMVGYNAGSSTPFELYNPWGINSDPGLIWVSASTLQEYFCYTTIFDANTTGTVGSRPVHKVFDGSSTDTSGSQSAATVNVDAVVSATDAAGPQSANKVDVDTIALANYVPSSTQSSESTTHSQTAMLDGQHSAHDLAFSTWDNDLELLEV
jgi:hypothetical protein